MHVSVIGALRMLGIGSRQVVRVPADEQGRMQADSRWRPRWRSGKVPTIVCAQAGNVNTGAFDPFEDIADAAHAARRLAPRGRRLRVVGGGQPDAAAAHARRRARRFVGDRRAQVAQRALRLRSRVHRSSGGAPRRDEHERRVSRAIAGRAARDDGLGAGVVPPRARLRRLRGAALAGPPAASSDLIDRCCRLARRFADRLRAEPAITILNDVVLNQVLVRVAPAVGRRGLATREALRRVQEERVCWLGGTRWHDMDAMRISVSNWSTTEEDIDASADSIIRAVRAVC